ncbi:DUF255 domain-containing protein [Candidatus Sulfurimonas marisnigri]|uniref:DUF255 domain-containing protein n=1 Tax=Candidatus Sulfurimonas marisnigri TaxID=2740405 RepID=A0A7S7RPY3_9BACT|nr:DUF255 domain-containing protein [Candidatus Sulfurimonas marisnigri]QOY54867.1 DUF255 domain-containing protein [Candidatus Sulfurimonas marisnigri]
MIKISMVLLFCFFNLSALEWHTYKDALKLQEKSSKVIMIDVIRTECQYCIKMDKNVFYNEEMSQWLEERFIPVKINLDNEEMPLDVEVKMTPTFYFLDKNNNIVKTIPGSWNIEDFKDLTKNIKGE